MSDHYIPDENWNPIPCDFMTWAEWFEKDERHVKETEIPWGSHTITVSTVFLGLDHNHFGDGPPILYETMAYIDEPNRLYDRESPITFIDNSQRRAATLGGAMMDHQLVVAVIEALLQKAPKETPLLRLLGSGQGSIE